MNKDIPIIGGATKTIGTYKQKLREALEAIKFIDFYQKKSNMNKRERKQFWRDFIKSETFRENYIEGIKSEFQL